MIKIPGTEEGVPAIEQAIFEGININVTLLFGVERYAAVAEAYIRGLERRLAEGLSLDVHSVASFFVSRVDTEVDKRLESLGRSDLAGTAALANARAAYRPRCAPRARWCSGRCGPRPARRTPPTRRRCTSTASSAPTR
jgi:transaldolase